MRSFTRWFVVGVSGSTPRASTLSGASNDAQLGAGSGLVALGQCSGMTPERSLDTTLCSTDDARTPAIGHPAVMPTGLGVGGDVEQALGSVGVPSYVVDTTGIVRWINPAAERLLGDVRGRRFTSVIAPEDRPGARDRFTQKMLGTAPTSEATGHLVSTAGTRVAVQVSSVQLKR